MAKKIKLFEYEGEFETRREEPKEHQYNFGPHGWGQDPWGMWVKEGNEDGDAYGTLEDALASEDKITEISRG